MEVHELMLVMEGTGSGLLHMLHVQPDQRSCLQDLVCCTYSNIPGNPALVCTGQAARQ